MLVQTTFEERTDRVKESARNRIFTEIGDLAKLGKKVTSDDPEIFGKKRRLPVPQP